MYTVQMEKECECLKKSEYSNINTFKIQQNDSCGTGCGCA